MTISLARRRFTCPEAYKDIVPSASSFDEVVAHLHLSPHQYRDSRELKEWVRHNKNEKYVPTEVLNAFGFDVDV